MDTPVETVKAKLVTIVAPSEARDSLTQALETLGASAYTLVKADGHGRHGHRRYGILDGANVLIETVVTAAVAQKILEHVVARYAGRAVIAYTMDVEAVPKEHFA